MVSMNIDISGSGAHNTPKFKSEFNNSININNSKIMSPRLPNSLYKSVPVQSYEGKHLDIINTSSTNIDIKKDSTKKTFNNLLIGGIAIALGSVTLAKVLKHKGPKNIGLNGLSEELAAIKTKFEETINKYPEDKKYYSDLVSGAGLNPDEEYRLASVVGPKQIVDILKNSSPQDFALGKDYSGIKNNTFRISLHNHTKASDGQFFVEELLDQASKWADRVAEKNPSNHKHPFILGITDHDTTEGAQQAVRLIAQNPEKYKNLKVVFGSEVSVTHMDPKDVVEPINFELVGYAQNPFNEKVNAHFANLRTSRNSRVKKLIDKTNAIYPSVNLSWEQAQGFHSNLAKGTTNGSVYLFSHYAKFKKGCQEYLAFTNGSEKTDDFYKRMVPQLWNRSNNNQIKGGDLNQFFNQIKKEEHPEVKAEFKLDEKFDTFVEDLRVNNTGRNSNNAEENTVTTPKEFFDMYKDSGDSGFFGAAHPGFIYTGTKYTPDVVKVCDTNGFDYGDHVIWRVFNHLKTEGGDNFRAYEKNYQGYNNLSTRQNWIDRITKTVENSGFNLLATGGVDCHQKSIFSKHTMLPANVIKDCNLEGIIGEKKNSK